MNRSGRLNGYEYSIQPDGVYFRREAVKPRAWIRASNFGISITDKGEVIDGQAWHTFRFEMDGVTVDRFLSRKRLWDIQCLATEALGACAVVFVVRGAQVRIHSALIACWLYPADIDDDFRKHKPGPEFISGPSGPPTPGTGCTKRDQPSNGPGAQRVQPKNHPRRPSASANEAAR